MTSEMIMLRPMRRTDFPALEELVRQAWYVDDESDDNGNVPNDERGLRKYKLRKAIHLRNMHRLAAIDMHDFLSRTTEATVAERDGRVLGVVLGSLRSRVTTAQRIRHAITRNCLALPLLASKDGRRGLADQIAILQVDEVLKRDAGKSYQAEITLFVVSPEARGMGVGRKLFNHMLGVFRNAGMNEYFLFTDTTCDYGFYDYRGLTRKTERTVRRDSFTQGGLEDGALSFFLYEGRC